MAVLEQGADEVHEESRAGFVNFLPHVIRDGVRARGGRARGLSEGGGNFFLAHREVIGIGGEVDVCQSWRWGGWKAVVKESRINAVGCILVREGGKAGCLTATREVLCLPYRGGGDGGEVFCPVGELGLLNGSKVGSAGGSHGGVVVGVPRGPVRSGG